MSTDRHKPPAITDAVATMKVRQYLSALRGTVLTPDAEAQFARTIQEVCVSVDHADATLERFDHERPTPHEITEVALHLKDRFSPPEDLVEKWKAQGYTYDPAFYNNVMTPLRRSQAVVNRVVENYAQALEILNQRAPGQLTPQLHDLMWPAIKHYLHVKDFSHVPFGQCWNAARDLGFPLTDHQATRADQWLATQPRPAVSTAQLPSAVAPVEPSDAAEPPVEEVEEVKP